MALWIALGIVASATMHVETAARRRNALIARVVAMIAATGLLAAISPFLVGAPVLLVGWAAVAWATGVGRAWPAYEQAWLSEAGAQTVVPDKRALPAFAIGPAFICMGIAQIASAFLLLSFLRGAAAQAGSGETYSLTWMIALFPAMLIISGLLSLGIAPKRNPWFSTQLAYAVAIFSQGESRSAAMKRAVDAAPERPVPLPSATTGV